MFSFCLRLIFLSFPLLTSSTPMYFIKMGLCIAWFHHQISTVVHVLFFDTVLANEPQSINCLYKHWTVKNHYLTDLHFTNLARISCWPALTEIPYRWSAVWIVTWHEMLVENILLNNSWGAVIVWDLGSIIPLHYTVTVKTEKHQKWLEW